MAGKIITLENTYYLEDIKSGDWDPDEPPFIREAFTFCQDWLNGVEEFELKTSGSTGLPKTILVNRSKMAKSAEMTAEFLQMSSDASLLCYLNPQMIAGKMMLVRGMEWKSELTIAPPSSLLPHPLDMKTYDLVAMVPMQVEKALQVDSNNTFIHEAKNIIVGGAPSPDRLRDKIRSWPGNFFQTFGMTETVSHIAMADLKTKGALIYKTLPGVKIETDASGRLCISSPTGIDSTILTNDIVEIISENEFVWKGRVDFVINSGGYKIIVEELETEIEQIWGKTESVPRFIIDKTADNLLGEKVVMIIEKNLPKIKLTELFSLLRSNLHPYKLPKEIFNVEKFVLTPSGKVNRAKTKEKLNL